MLSTSALTLTTLGNNRPAVGGSPHHGSTRRVWTPPTHDRAGAAKLWNVL